MGSDGPLAPSINAVGSALDLLGERAQQPRLAIPQPVTTLVDRDQLGT
jgi:hypothetical protein